MKKGAYVIFTADKRKYRGRIYIDDIGNFYLCQSAFHAGNCDEQYGHEHALNLGRDNEYINRQIKQFGITVVTKANWIKHKERYSRVAFGYEFEAIKGRKDKDTLYSFGCGAIQLTRSQIKQFIANRDKYLRISKRRDELQKQLTEETKIVNEWLSQREGTRDVINSLKGRSLKPENADINKLKQLFK